VAFDVPKRLGGNAHESSIGLFKTLRLIIVAVKLNQAKAEEGQMELDCEIPTANDRHRSCQQRTAIV
jgi:Asp-tRNA(Asn)/Glu-tRNA(Gln) amidotransferase B subunit